MIGRKAFSFAKVLEIRENVSAMSEFIFNEDELLRVQETLVKAAFAQVYRKGKCCIADNV